MARHFAVIGAGPAGLAAAYEFSRRGHAVSLYDATVDVGGLARSIDLWGHRIDLGPHIFSGGPSRAVDLWERFLGPDPHVVPLRRGILVGSRVIDHPPGAIDAALRLPARTAARCAAGLLVGKVRQRIFPSAADDAQQWITDRYGRSLYGVFARNYVEKLWGRSGDLIHADFARSLFGSAKGVTGPRSTFQFPRGGTGSVWARIAKAIELTTQFHMGCRIESLVVRDGHAVGLHVNGRLDTFDGIVSTMPIVRLLDAIGAPGDVRQAATSLEARNVIVVHLLVEGGPPLDRAWLFVDDPANPIGRLVDSRTWHGAGSTPGIITVECWCGDADPIWTESPYKTLERVRAALLRTGVFPAQAVLDGRVTKLRGILPVPTVASRGPLQAAREYVESLRGLVSVGRHGSFSYNSMAESIADGVAAADLLAPP